MDNERNVASVRTALPLTWGAVIAYLNQRFGLKLNDLEMLGLAAGAGVLLHRVSFVLQAAKSKFWRGVATILVGIKATPDYTPASPPPASRPR